MRRRRILLTLTAILVGIVALQRPAAADCAGPTPAVEEGDYLPGEPVPVSGQWFGDNCYDTGPPPPGEGTLGRPIADIEVWFEQGDTEWLVAVGAADADYAWSVAPPVPLDASPGDLAVVLRYEAWGGPQEWPVASVTVLAGEPVGTVPVEPIRFGPDDAALEPPAPEPADPPTTEAPVPDPIDETEPPAGEPVDEEPPPDAPTTTVPADDSSTDSDDQDSDGGDDSRGRNIALGIAAAGGAVAGLLVLSKRTGA